MIEVTLVRNNPSILLEVLDALDYDRALTRARRAIMRVKPLDLSYECYDDEVIQAIAKCIRDRRSNRTI